jgi:hypothetical protein
VGGDGGQDGGQDVGGGKEKKDAKGKGKHKGSKGKGEGKVGVKENTHSEIKKEDGNKTTGNANEENKGVGGGTRNAGASGTTATSEKPEGAGGGKSEELLQEVTKLLKSLHLPSVKSISLQEVGDVTQNQEGKMSLDSGATHALRRAASWLEWEEATPTVVALAQGTTSKLPQTWNFNFAVHTAGR